MTCIESFDAWMQKFGRGKANSGEQRDVASLKTLEMHKKTIRWNPCLNNWEKLLGEIEQFQIQWERAAGNASVKEKISNYEPFQKAMKDQIKEMRSSTIFKRIWAWNGPQRMKIFLWKLHKGALLTNYERVRRGLTNDASCKVCSAADEMILHAIRYCDLAKTVWSCIVPIVALRDFFGLDNVQWVEQNLTRGMGSYGSNHWGIMFGVTAYCIWQARNEIIFQNLRSSHVDIIRRVWHNLGEIMVTCDVRSGSSYGSALNSETFCCHAPPDLWIKVKTGGSISQSSLLI
ncbi:Reverse transcriptase zinc-binding domain [Sesbania bispinosa]|nr:Reverse transcriptase zinc-binding domain [Sesbania bispinosa]